MAGTISQFKQQVQYQVVPRHFFDGPSKLIKLQVETVSECNIANIFHRQSYEDGFKQKLKIQIKIQQLLRYLNNLFSQIWRLVQIHFLEREMENQYTWRKQLYNDSMSWLFDNLTARLEWKVIDVKNQFSYANLTHIY
ncbi:Hypothetical_protein [Hexamita inflata]|uniref:Hypothetical_protein n=1 Tax=Hexamita inflata TaxID=28002 RepID=A0AA86V0W2_9EUKA|nr:Hypothetical protein HINF_LOCUS59552 [Hexamita inflata]